MKTFRIHLKDGKSFTVKAHHFVRNAPEGRIDFYKDDKAIDTDILVFSSDVVAVVPETKATPTVPFSV